MKKFFSALLVSVLLFTMCGALMVGAADGTSETEVDFQGKINEWQMLFAQNQGNILYPTAGKLKRNNKSQVLSGFAVTPDEKFAFCGFTGSSGHRRSLETIDLATGQSLSFARHAFVGTADNYTIETMAPDAPTDDINYSAPRALAVGDGNTLFIGLELYSEDISAINYGIFIGVATYSEEGVVTLQHYTQVFKAETAELMFKGLKYKVVDGAAYLYVLTGDNYDNKDAHKNRDRIYRFTVSEENELELDTSFGVNAGYSTLNDLDLVDNRNFENNFYEMWGIDVANDGTIYITGNSSLGIAKITPDGKSAVAWGDGLGLYFTKGGLCLFNDDKYLLVFENEGENYLGLRVYYTNTGETLPDEYAYRIMGFDKTIVRRIFCLTNVNGNIYASDRGGAEATTAVDRNTDKIFRASYSETYEDITCVGYQKTEADENGLYNTRFVAVIDTLRYSAAGFKITITKEDNTVVEYTEEQFKVNTAYSIIMSSEDEIEPETFGGKYFVVVVLPDQTGTFTVDIKPYVIRSGQTEYVYGGEHSFTVTP